MTNLLVTSTSKGKLTITESHVIVRLAGTERAILRSTITSVSSRLSLWVIFGFLRSVTIYAAGQPPLTVGNLSKRRARAIMSLLGF